MVLNKLQLGRDTGAFWFLNHPRVSLFMMVAKGSFVFSGKCGFVLPAPGGSERAFLKSHRLPETPLSEASWLTLSDCFVGGNHDGVGLRFEVSVSSVRCELRITELGPSGVGIWMQRL